MDSFPSIYVTKYFLLSCSQGYVTYQPSLSQQEHEVVYWQENKDSVQTNVSVLLGFGLTS